MQRLVWHLEDRIGPHGEHFHLPSALDATARARNTLALLISYVSAFALARPPGCRDVDIAMRALVASATDAATGLAQAGAIVIGVSALAVVLVEIRAVPGHRGCAWRAARHPAFAVLEFTAVSAVSLSFFVYAHLGWTAPSPLERWLETKGVSDAVAVLVGLVGLTAWFALLVYLLVAWQFLWIVTRKSLGMAAVNPYLPAILAVASLAPAVVKLPGAVAKLRPGDGRALFAVVSPATGIVTVIALAVVEVAWLSSRRVPVWDRSRWCSHPADDFTPYVAVGDHIFPESLTFSFTMKTLLLLLLTEFFLMWTLTPASGLCI